MTQLLMATAGGEAHGLINQLPNSVAFDDFKNMKPEDKKAIEKQKKEDARFVKAEYMNSRGRHERLTTPYCKYAGDPIQIWHLIPGKIYNIPMGLVNQVNDKNKVMAKRSGLVSLDGANVTETGAPTTRDEEGDWLHKLVPCNFN